MNLVSVLVASALSIVILLFTFQGVNNAIKAQALLKQKTDLIILSQGINNVLQDETACTLSKNQQTVYYSNNTPAYVSGVNGISNFVWTMQGTTTVLTIKPVNSMFKPIVLNLTCSNNCNNSGVNNNGVGH